VRPKIVVSKLAQKRIDLHELVKAAAERHQVEPALVKSIVAAESAFNSDAVSPRGAVGLMQIMPATALQYGLDAHVPEQNVDAGARYLRVLSDRYHQYRDRLRRVIAAYNAGPAAVDRYQGVPPYPETQSYVARVLAFFHLFQKERG
jgi:soluble lytic murein transglycosylase-like protein